MKNTRFFFLLFLLLSFVLTACDLTATNPGPTPTTSSKSQVTTSGGQKFTFSNNPSDVVIRTFYGGGIYGALELSPEISIYGDGSYILGGELDLRQGKLDSASLSKLMLTLVDTYGLLNFSRNQFSDIQDADATLLELAVNGSNHELLYGKFGYQSESTQDLDQYNRLEKALTAITDALNGPTQTYTNDNVALLVRQTFSPDFSKDIYIWRISDFTLDHTALFECGAIPQDVTGPNSETGCLKYLIPLNAVLLTPDQLAKITAIMGNAQVATFEEYGLYYTVTLRPLLPDEIQTQTVAMFGSTQTSFKAVSLSDGTVPTPTATP